MRKRRPFLLVILSSIELRVAAGAVLGVALLTQVAPPAAAGTQTSGLFAEFTATKNQEELPASLSTKQMCPDRPGTHTFAPDLRVENGKDLVITDTFTGFEFAMTLTRRGVQPTLEKIARFRVTRTGTRPIQGGASRINFFLQPGDCVDLVFAPQTALTLLNKEVLTASLFLTKEPSAPAGPPPPPPPGPEPLASCTIGFDGSCPNTGAQCGATFAGGNGCVSIGVGACYSSGAFSYEMDPGETVTIQLDGDLVELDVFLAARGSGQGTMTFFDSSGTQVGNPLETNGDCTNNMPPSQRVTFATPVRSIEVTTTGSPSFIDTFRVNPQ